MLREPHVPVENGVSPVSPCTILTLPGNELLALFERDREMGYRVMSNLARLIGSRLRVTRQKLVLEMGTTAHLASRG